MQVTLLWSLGVSQKAVSMDEGRHFVVPYPFGRELKNLHSFRQTGATSSSCFIRARTIDGLNIFGSTELVTLYKSDRKSTPETNITPKIFILLHASLLFTFIPTMIRKSR
jgi:hypothetical protein